MIVHFQIAVAGPIFLASLPIILFKIFKHKKFLHLRSILVFLLIVSNYLLFDLRHSFQLSKAVLKYVSGSTESVPLDLNTMLNNRYSLITNDGIYIFGKNKFLNSFVFYLFLFTALGLIYKRYLRKTKIDSEESLFIVSFYIFLSFYCLSLIHKGWLLDHYYLPIISIPILLVAIGTKLCMNFFTDFNFA